MSAWILGDGRFKCRECSTRYSYKSVWDSVRLPDATKEQLLDAFVHGVPVYRQRFDDGACVDSRERFYRLARACCALHEAIPHTPAPVVACKQVSYRGTRSWMRGWSMASEVMFIGITIQRGTVRIVPLSAGNLAEFIPLLRERVAIGGSYCIQDDFAIANLQVQGDYVVMHRRARTAAAANSIENFWERARQRLQVLRKIPCRFLHLYLGEMCFRFNHRDADAAAALRELLQSLSTDAIKPLICRVVANPGPVTSGTPVQFGIPGRAHIGMTLRGE
jgi:transposase